MSNNVSSTLDKTLHRMKISIKTTELPGTPARGFSSSLRNWRVTLSRPIKDEEKPLKMTLTMISATEPTLPDVIQCLSEDIDASELSMWDFAQEFNKGKTDKAAENMYRTVKRATSKAQKFFGDSKIIRNVLGIQKAA